MAALQQLFSEKDLAAMSVDQRQFLIDRIEYYFGSPEVMTIVASKIQETVRLMQVPAGIEVQRGPYGPQA